MSFYLVTEKTKNKKNSAKLTGELWAMWHLGRRNSRHIRIPFAYLCDERDERTNNMHYAITFTDLVCTHYT